MRLIVGLRQPLSQLPDLFWHFPASADISGTTDFLDQHLPAPLPVTIKQVSEQADGRRESTGLNLNCICVTHPAPRHLVKPDVVVPHPRQQAALLA